jgi:predicted phosphodiesterase
VAALGGALGVIVALAVRGGPVPRLRYTIGTGARDHGRRDRRAHRAAPAPRRDREPAVLRPRARHPGGVAGGRGGDPLLPHARRELNTQLVGLAQLVIAPGDRAILEDSLPRAVIASDLHNHALALSVLERTARGAPVLFVGDATDRGSPLETSVVRRIARSGNPLVFVSGNHDSDTLIRSLTDDGAIVLTETGRLMPDGSRGPVVANVAGLRIAGYADRSERRSGESFADRYKGGPTPEEQQAFDAWFAGSRAGRRRHGPQPALAATTLERLRADPPASPVLFAVGHTHRAGLERIGNLTVVNSGSIGGGGTGNLGEGTPLGLAVLVYARERRFRPLAADLVSISPGTGSSTARRERLDAPQLEGSRR